MEPPGENPDPEPGDSVHPPTLFYGLWPRFRLDGEEDGRPAEAPGAAVHD